MLCKYWMLKSRLVFPIWERFEELFDLFFVSEKYWYPGELLRTESLQKGR